MSSVAKYPPPPPPPQWVLDLDSPAAPKPKNASAVPNPPGYGDPTTVTKKGKSSAQVTEARKPPSAAEMDTLKLKKAWEVAIAPAKALPMSAIGMYMTGNSLQIFSIFMLFQLFKTPFTGLMNMQQAFVRFESEGTRQQMIMVKVVYVLCNLLGIAMGLWKIDQMGLLPTTRSDWLAWETRRMPLETAVPDPSLLW